jgi:hypothetical protein
MVTNMDESERLEKLEAFFLEVAYLTSHHNVLDDSAVVYPRDLGIALSRVDPDWWKTLNGS